MMNPRSRLAIVSLGFVAGAILGLKTVVLLGFVVGIEPSLAPGIGLALACAWIFAVATAFAVAATGMSRTGRKVPAGRMGDEI